MIVTTTGTLATVTLGSGDSEIILTHPQTYDLVGEDSIWDGEDLAAYAADVNAAIAAGTITAETADGEPITEISASGAAGVQEINGLVGAIVNLTTDEIPEGTTNLYFNAANTATPAQGALADTALQPGDNVSELVNDAGYALAADLPADTDDVPEGSTNLYYTDARVTANPTVAANTLAANNAQAQANNNSVNIGSNDADISDLQTDVTSVQGDVVVNASDIANLQNDLASHTHTTLYAPDGITAQAVATPTSVNINANFLNTQGITAGGVADFDDQVTFRSNVLAEDEVEFQGNIVAPNGDNGVSQSAVTADGDTFVFSGGLCTSYTPGVEILKDVTHISGRMYCYSNERWVSANPSYGPTYYQWFENGGNGATPILEWEHRGFLFPAGTRIKNFTFEGRSNNSQVTGIKVAAYVKDVDLQDYSLTIDSDAEANYVQVIPETDVITGITSGNFQDMRQGRIEDIDFDMPQTGEVVIYLKPLGNMSTTRYVYFTFSIEVELPA